MSLKAFCEPEIVQNGTRTDEDLIRMKFVFKIIVVSVTRKQDTRPYLDLDKHHWCGRKYTELVDSSKSNIEDGSIHLHKSVGYFRSCWLECDHSSLCSSGTPFRLRYCYLL